MLVVALRVSRATCTATTTAVSREAQRTLLEAGNKLQSLNRPLEKVEGEERDLLLLGKGATLKKTSRGWRPGSLSFQRQSTRTKESEGKPDKWHGSCNEHLGWVLRSVGKNELDEKKSCADLNRGSQKWRTGTIWGSRTLGQQVHKKKKHCSFGATRSQRISRGARARDLWMFWVPLAEKSTPNCQPTLAQFWRQ